MRPKHARFVAEYLIDLNATQAAIRAGYSEKTANRIGSRLLSYVDIAEAVKVGQAKRLESNELSASRVLEEMRRLAFADLRSFFDDAGNLKPIRELTAEQGAVLGSVEVVHRNLTSGDKQTDTIHKIKTWDKVRALEMLGKHFALLTEQVQHSGGLEISWKGQDPAAD